jgi:hypothetical protein
MRLFEEGDHADGTGAGAGGAVGMGGDDNDRQRVAASAQFFEDVEAVDVRHRDVEDQAVAAGRPRAIEKRPPG